MIVKILLLCGTIEQVLSDIGSRYPHKYHGHKQWGQDQRISTNPQPSSLPEEHWERELGREETRNQASVAVIEKDDFDTGYHPSRSGNWCSSVQSRLVTYIAACKTEKYVIKSQQPCPNGTPDCQKVMYRAALKPVYQVKQKVVSSLHWKCCPGYIGKKCEHHEPNFLPTPTDQTGSWEEDKEIFSSQNVGAIRETHQRHEALLEDLQNDIHQATNHLGTMQKALRHNVTSTRGAVSHNYSDDRAALEAIGEGQGKLLQQMLFSHVENVLREHFHPVWASFNKSIQDLSTAVKNLSQNVEANRRNIEIFQDNTVPKKDFQELGTKFESKIQDNILKVDQMKKEIESHFHQQQAAIHYNLTMIKADTDIKLKRNHKIQHMYLMALNHSIADMIQEQNRLQGELEALSRSLAFPVQLGSQNEPFADIDVQVLNQTLAEHSEQLKELYKESDEDYQELTRSISNLKVNLRQDIENIRVDSMEKSLIIEEYREDLERKIQVLNDTLANIEEGHWDVQRSLKACRCENLPLGIDMKDQVNISQINREEMKQLEARLKDLAAAFPLIHQSLDFQQEQSRKLEGGMSLLKAHTEKLSQNITDLKKNDERTHGNIKYLNSSFNSLLVDAIRHEKALEAVLGDEIMEDLSEDDTGTILSPSDPLQVPNIRLILEHLKKQNYTLESLINRIHSLEMELENDLSAHKFMKHPVVENEEDDAAQEVSTQHGRVEHMEPNHEAAMEDTLDNPAYHDIMTLKKEIGHIGREMKKYESQWNLASFCCNQTRFNFMEPLTVSVENLRTDLASTQQSFEEHLQIFQKLFGTNKELAAANVSLDVAKIQSLVGRRMRKQLQTQDNEKIRGKEEVKFNREGNLNGRNKIHTGILETSTAVAFYVRYPEGESTSSFNRTYLNYGEGYYPEHGYFKSPQSGIYMVAISMELPPGPVLGQLVVSSGYRITLMSNKKRKANGVPLTSFALIQLNKGEHLSFQLIRGAAVTREPPGLSMAGFLISRT